MRPTNTILGQHFSIAGQLRFTFPRMLMSLFIMSYMVADGVLISRYMGTVALASLNMIFPLAIFLGAVGIMLSAGICLWSHRGTLGYFVIRSSVGLSQCQ